ncbi:MAG: hypothetical protein CFE36_09640 [Sphingomonadaceae bacterium PASS1]|nr:MAG: hypothetical protein CFE36_09640 [Sphingomonadaceae bacterium PASS1]
MAWIFFFITIAVPVYALIFDINVEAQYALGLYQKSGVVNYDKNDLSWGGLLNFLLLMIPRLLLIVFMIKWILRKSEVFLYNKPIFLILWPLVIVTNLYYLIAAMIALTAAYIASMGRLSRLEAWSIMLSMAFLAVLAAIGLSRGLLFYAVILLLIGFQYRTVFTQVFMGMVTALLFLATTLAKFDNAGPISALNIFYRTSSYGQYVAHEVFRPEFFDPGTSLTVDLFWQLPLVRNFGEMLDEEVVFGDMFGDSGSAFAVSPELRAIAHWGELGPAVLDLSFAYGALIVLVVGLSRLFPHLRLGLGLCLPLLIQMDSPFSVAYYLQSAVCVAIILKFNDLLNNSRKSNLPSNLRNLYSKSRIRG